MKRTLLLLAAMLAHPTLACYNDRDTLGFELRDRPDAQRALTGRFERNAPLYYAMRAARLRSLPRLTAAEHDDLAVALGRLGREEEALASLDPKTLRTADDRYRFFANRGTLRAHRWLRRGSRDSERSDLKLATDDVAHALEINPKAHFGREATQLEVLRWLEGNADGETLGQWLEKRVEGVDPARGLEGLIMLGGAWESPDVVYAIAEVSDDPKTFSTAEFAYARYRELRAKTGHPLRSDDVEDDRINLELGKTPPAEEPPVEETFRRLREEAEAWNARRTAFMLVRLKAGRHPDTDPTFWRGWHDAPMPRLDPERKLRATEVQYRRLMEEFVAAVVAVLLFAFLVTRLIVRRVARSRA